MFAIIRSLFVVAVAVAAVSAGTQSYFSKTDTSTGNTISAGTLTVDLKNHNETTDLDFDVSGIAPGGTKLVNFDVVNGGTALLPVHLRGFATGEWVSVSSPDNNLMKVVKVEYWNGSVWQELDNEPTGITGMFYYSSDGTDTGTLMTIPAGEKAQFQLTVKLDESAGDKYQEKAYNASITVQTKQSTAPSWPADLTGF